MRSTACVRFIVPPGTALLIWGVTLAVPALGQTLLQQLQASTPGSVFGEAVRSAGDVDGDGLQDLLVGEPAFDPGGIPKAGRATLWSSASWTMLASYVGATPDSGLGARLGRPGDLTGDGVTDFLVGGYFFPLGGGVGYPPVVRDEYFEVCTLSGAVVGFHLGHAAAWVGDLDGDGVGDLVAGQPHYAEPPCSLSFDGRAYAISGAAGPLLTQWDGWFCLNESLGYAVEPLEDITGDGLPDFAVGSGGYIGVPPSVRMYSGLGAVPAWQFTTIPGAIQAIALVGDVNGDGTQDLAVGAPGQGPLEGIVYVLSGSNGAQIYQVGAFSLNQRLGRSVGRLGDLDGDGFPDVLVGGSFMVDWYSAIQYPTAWPTSIQPGHAYVVSGPTGSVLVDLVEPPPGEAFGASVDGLGDVNGDDYPDFAVSKPYGQASTPGEVFFYSGAPVGVGVFGSGCASPSGVVPRIAAWPAAVPGANVSLRISRALGGTPAVLLVGLSNSSWSGIPLPASLGPLGLPSCDLLVSPDIQVPLLTQGSGPTNGRASVTVSIPAVPALSGAILYAQWYAVDPGPGLLPGVLTRGMQVTIQ